MEQEQNDSANVKTGSNTVAKAGDEPARVARAVAQLHERIASDRTIDQELFTSLSEEQIRVGLSYDGRAICQTLRPFIVSQNLYRKISHAAETLAVAFERLTAHALQDESLLDRFGLTDKERTLVRYDPGYPHLCMNSRLDAFLTNDGFQFLEYNAESPSGVTDQMLLENLLFRLPHMREFLETHAHLLPAPHTRILPALVETYRACGGKLEKPNICICDWRGVATESEFFVLKEMFEREGHATLIADPHDLEYNGETLSVGAFRVDILYKRVIIHEFLAEFDLTHPLVLAYRDRKVCMANSFRTKLPHKKAGFAILSDERFAHLFTSEQLQAIHQHIPWTRRLVDEQTTYKSATHDLLKLVEQERASFVLKPNDDYGGHGVLIGAETEADAWRQAISDGLRQDYVVQERVEVVLERMPMLRGAAVEWDEVLVDFDPFLFVNKAEGGMVRVSTTSLCNVTSGGGITALLVLK